MTTMKEMGGAKKQRLEGVIIAYIIRWRRCTEGGGGGYFL